MGASSSTQHYTSDQITPIRNTHTELTLNESNNQSTFKLTQDMRKVIGDEQILTVKLAYTGTVQSINTDVIDQSINQSNKQSKKRVIKGNPRYLCRTRRLSFSVEWGDESYQSKKGTFTVNQSNEQSVNQSMNESDRQSLYEPPSPTQLESPMSHHRTLDHAINRSNNQSINQSPNQSNNPSPNQSPSITPRCLSPQSISRSIRRPFDDQLTDEPHQSINQSTNPPNNQSNDQSNDQSASQENKHPIRSIHIRSDSESINQSNKQSINQSIDQSNDKFPSPCHKRKLTVYQSINQSINQSKLQHAASLEEMIDILMIDQSINQSINGTFNQSTFDCLIDVQCEELLLQVLKPRLEFVWAKVREEEPIIMAISRVFLEDKPVKFYMPKKRC